MSFRSAVFAVAVASMAPFAAQASWAIDPAHTRVSFTVDHLGFSQVEGAFRTFDAELVFDPENLAATEVSFTIDAASIDTLWPARDEHIRSADFLDVANHPEITFVSTSVSPEGDDMAKVTGDLTIRGVTQEVTLDAKLNQVGPNPFNPAQQIAGVTLTGEIDRTAFGIDFGAPVIGAVMPLMVSVEMVQGG